MCEKIIIYTGRLIKMFKLTKQHNKTNNALGLGSVVLSLTGSVNLDKDQVIHNISFLFSTCYCFVSALTPFRFEKNKK